MRLSDPDPTLTDGCITLRNWAERDLSCLKAASHDPRIPEGTTVPVPYSAEAGLAFIARQHGRLTRGEGIALAVAEAATDEAIGQINLLYRPEEGVAGIGYWLLETRRSRGLGLRGVRLLTRWAFERTDLVSLEALVEPGNVASIRVLERAGFQYEGLLRS